MADWPESANGVRIRREIRWIKVCPRNNSSLRNSWGGRSDLASLGGQRTVAGERFSLPRGRDFAGDESGSDLLEWKDGDLFVQIVGFATRIDHEQLPQAQVIQGNTH